MKDQIERQDAIEVVKRQRKISWENWHETRPSAERIIEDLKELPSAQSETHDKRMETHGVCLDTIDRQATLDWLKNEWNGMITSLFDGIKALPSAQPELPEWAQKVEEYRKSAPSFVRNQLVWALYQTWKEYDGRLVHQRGKENR